MRMMTYWRDFKLQISKVTTNLSFIGASWLASAVNRSGKHTLASPRLQGRGGKRRCASPLFLRDSATYFNEKFEI